MILLSSNGENSNNYFHTISDRLITIHVELEFQF